MANRCQDNALQTGLVEGAQVFVNQKLDHYLNTEGKEKSGYKELTRNMFRELEKHLSENGTEEELKKFHNIVETVFIFDYTRRL